MKELINRLRALEKSTNRVVVVDNFDIWDHPDHCGCTLCRESERSYIFYLEESPRATGCSWLEFFEKRQAAGFISKDITYEQYMEKSRRW
jgi:hypothetical protein